MVYLFSLHELVKMTGHLLDRHSLTDLHFIGARVKGARVRVLHFIGARVKVEVLR